MKSKVLIFCFLILMLGGCNQPSLSVTQINEDHLRGGLVKFVERIQEKNGIYLFSETSNQQYLLLNYSNVIQGEKPSYLEDFKTEVKDQNLIINFSEVSSDNEADDQLGKLNVFEIINDGSFDTILIFKNGKATSIDLVGG